MKLAQDQPVNKSVSFNQNVPFNQQASFAALSTLSNELNLSGVVIDWYIKQKCCSCHTSVPHCHAAVGANKVSALKILVELASKDIINSENLLRNLQLPGELLHSAKPR